MNRSLKLSIMLALAMGSGHAAALELGQIQVKSALGQPLVAEIPVKPDHPGEIDHLTAQLAPADAFSKAGASAPPMLLQFSVVDSGNGGKIIRVTSSTPVNDPYLDLLVEIGTGSNKSVHEFPLLLDPPTNTVGHRAPAGSAPRHAATPAPAPEASNSRPSRTETAPAPARQRVASPPVAEGGKVTVERGQSLSTIARQSLQGGADMNQMLLAFKQVNPDAFYRDNINALKSGAVLRVPTKDEVQATTTAAALAEVRRQNSDWRAGATRTPTSVADAGTRANATTSPTRGGGGDRLALVPAKSSETGGNGKGEAAALHQDLQRSQEQLSSLQQQSSELKSRLKDLEDINTKNERLLTLKDNEIAELQRKLADARKAGGAPAAASTAKAPTTPIATVTKSTVTPQPSKPATIPTPAVTPPAPVAAHTTTMPAGTAMPAHAGTAQPVASQPAPPVKPAVKPTPKPVPAPAPVEEAPWFMQPWAWAAGAGVVVLLALAALLRRRKAAPIVAPTGGSSSLADRFGAVPPLGEEDLDQEELLDQLAEHPDDIGLHLELVSLYYSRRDVEHFEAAAEAMHAHITDPQQPEWQDVVHMGEDLVPNHPLFAHGQQSSPFAGEDERAALHHFDLDEYASAPSPSVPPPVAGQNQKVSEYHFDFNLTPHPIVPPPVQEPDAIPHSDFAPEVEAEPHHAAEGHAHSTWEFADDEPLLDEPAPISHAPAPHEAGETDHSSYSHELGGFSDDPIDTKLDLARAYLDMGDPEGARAMLEEVLHEGNQMQKDTAHRLLEDLR
ncbi:FimV/HubP family polar landmark protein [Dyella sp.]|uniref:FimV/HubP family polar landmark protein n=1 Tax=Dyella sp. TaxID=1869338 RepID=UPI002ED2A170